MKIRIMPQVMNYSISVRGKRDGESSQFEDSFASSQRQKEQRKRHGEKIESEENETLEIQNSSQEILSEDKVHQAVESFQIDQLTKANGLVVNIEGQWPGLKVLLKDEFGSVVRQFTAEEFLKLRDAASKEGRSCGKILDQKL